MIKFAYFFPFIFIGMWILVAYLTSKMGWTGLAGRYRTDEKFEGKKVGIISASINSGNYRNVIILKYSHAGIYLKTTFLFRLFHPPVLIPWNEIMETRNKKIFFTNFKELVIGDPFVALVMIKASVYNKIDKPAGYKIKC